MKNKMVLMTIALCTITAVSQAAPQNRENEHKDGRECKHNWQEKRRDHGGHEGHRDHKEKKETPLAVTQAFQKDFPTITKMHWDDENGSYEVRFRQNGFKTSAIYDSTGYKKELEIEINTNDLPVKAQEYIRKTYPNIKIEEATKTTSDKNVITYEAEVEINGKDTNLLFDANGVFIK